MNSRETHVNDRLYSYITHTDVTIGNLTTAVNQLTLTKANIKHKRVRLQRFDDDESYRAITVWDSIYSPNHSIENNE
ncbi:hypothetical protein T10_888 [Trichinella papuae]|uniref:Uncharacterized protein n=1 Tax=Trichinella papuae TaxID=268474 RepID=A0A0V1N775_9BILA|nr:hypothetical protein T10_888 [Trichinella papuae]